MQLLVIVSDRGAGFKPSAPLGHWSLDVWTQHTRRNRQIPEFP